jgi:ABC-type polysaccharide/polyol phosphate export permease
LLGLLLYSYFSEGILRGVTSLHDRSTVILKVNFPKVIAVYTSVANSLISFLAGFLVFLVFWFWSKPLDSLSGLGYFSLLVLVLSGLILGLNLFSGIIYTKLKDFFSVWEVALQLIFWGTPIVYPLSILPEPLQRLSILNPLAVIITQSRIALIDGGTYDWRLTAYVAGLTAILLLGGFKFFSSRITKVAEDF